MRARKKIAKDGEESTFFRFLLSGIVWSMRHSSSWRSRFEVASKRDHLDIGRKGQKVQLEEVAEWIHGTLGQSLKTGCFEWRHQQKSFRLKRPHNLDEKPTGKPCAGNPPLGLMRRKLETGLRFDF